jgi:hypothetical protein
MLAFFAEREQFGRSQNQRFEINRFCEDKTMVVERWIEEPISGTKTTL